MGVLSPPKTAIWCPMASYGDIDLPHGWPENVNSAILGHLQKNPAFYLKCINSTRHPGVSHVLTKQQYGSPWLVMDILTCPMGGRKTLILSSKVIYTKIPYLFKRNCFQSIPWAVLCPDKTAI